MNNYIVHFTGAAKDSKGVCELHTVCVSCENHTHIPEAIRKLGYTKASGYKWSIAAPVVYPLAST